MTVIGPPARRVTIRDVAREAGVSVTTVSNVMNGRVASMTPETLTRVEETIRELGYRRNANARGLVRRKTSTIGLVIAEIETPLFLQAITVVQPAAQRAGYDVFIHSANDEASEARAVDLLLEQDVAGVVFLSTSGATRHDHLQPLIDAGKPVVLVNRAGAPESLDRVGWDNAGGIVALVDHLVALGHRRISHLAGPPHRQSSGDRLRGFLEGVARHGLTASPERVRSVDYAADPETWRVATLALISTEPRPTAIIAADDMVAAVAMQALHDAGLAVPWEISIAGVDDQPFASLLSPALTTVRLPVLEAGHRAIAMLLDRLAGHAPPPRHEILPCPLIVRVSSAAVSPDQKERPT
jgi:LacI family transcriptional regulator